MFKALIICLTVLTTGCASMFSGTTQNLLLRSDVRGTKLYLNNEEVGTDTATVQISKKNLGNAVLLAKKPGCSDYSTVVSTKFDATTLLGVLIDFGLITVLVVDWGITGAVREAERTSYVLNPTCGS